jgi:hypothetical protein
VGAKMCPLTHFENLVWILFLMPIPTIIQFEISKNVKKQINFYKKILCHGHSRGRVKMSKIQLF